MVEVRAPVEVEEVEEEVVAPVEEVEEVAPVEAEVEEVAVQVVVAPVVSSRLRTTP